MSDEGFHEIQLNGKQLVFLFMAATVVSVVIFLCGVMVGRGVRTDQASSVSADASLAADSDSDSAARALEADQPPPAPARGGTNAGAPPAEPPVPPFEEMDVTSQLEAARPRDTLKAPPEDAPPPSARQEKTDSPAPKSEPERRAEAEPQAPPAAATGPTQQGAYAVQLAALRERGDAEAMVSRLVDKGYPAYLLLPQPGKPPVYRVQVGRYNSRGDAEKTAARLKKEEQFSPWVTR